MDGILLDSEILKAESWKNTLLEYGFYGGNDFYMRYIGNTRRFIAERAVQEYNFLGDSNEIMEKNKEYYQELLKLEVKPIDSSIEFLRSLSRFKRGLASSETTKNIINSINTLGIYNLFDVITSGSEEAKHDKPHPEIYTMTAQKLGFHPENCFAIEDTMSGVISTKSAGMYCIGFRNPNSGNQDLSKADIVTDDLRKLQIIKLEELVQ